MEDTEKKTLCDHLADIDGSLFFLLLLLVSLILSFLSVTIQRKTLCSTIQGDTQAASSLPPVYPIKHASSSLAVGGLGFFLYLAIKALRTAQAGDDPVALRSAHINLWASILVLCAAILRFDDLNFVEESRQPALLEADLLPS